MNKQTETIKSELISIPTYRQRNKFIENKYKNQKCYIISCGPSLARLDFQKISEKLKGELVICIKQSYEHFKDICDVHIYNCANYKDYKYQKQEPIIVESTSFAKILNPRADLRYQILERRFQASVSLTSEFDKWTMSNVVERPYGPGVMYETVFYFAKHLGVNEIITIGWDNSLKGTEQKYVHYYDILGGDRKKYVESNDQKTEVSWSSLTKEEQITVDAMGAWYKWLKSQGIELKIVSDTNPAPEYVPRISMQEFSK